MQLRPDTSIAYIVIFVLFLSLGIWAMETTLHKHCQLLSQTQILNALLPTASSYDLSTNGYSPNNCYYAVDVLIGSSTPLNDQNSDNPILGTWIISTHEFTIRRISAPSEYASVFQRWISNDQLLLNSDNGDVSAVYDVKRQTVLIHMINTLMLRFTRLSSDVSITPQPMADVPADPSCTKPSKTNEGFFFYPLACLKWGSVVLAVPHYGSFTVEYRNPREVYINGRPYYLSDTHGVEIDL